jgi:hypothetical protein
VLATRRRAAARLAHRRLGAFLGVRVRGAQAVQHHGARLEERLRLRLLDVARVLTQMLDQLTEHLLHVGGVIAGIRVGAGGFHVRCTSKRRQSLRGRGVGVLLGTVEWSIEIECPSRVPCIDLAVERDRKDPIPSALPEIDAPTVDRRRN